MVPNYALLALSMLHASTCHCPDARNGDRLLLQAPRMARPCRDRFTGMVTTEMDHILDRLPEPASLGVSHPG